MHRFKELEIWNKSRKFCTAIYNVTADFPTEEKLNSLTIDIEEIIKMTSKFRTTLMTI